MSSRSKLILTASALIILGSVFAVWTVWGQRYQIRLSEAQLVARMNEKFPFRKTYFFVIDLNLSNPTLALEEGSNRITFGCDVETHLKVEVDHATAPGLLHGKAKISGRVRYDPSAGTFFLDEPAIESLDVAGIPVKWWSKIKTAASHAVTEFLHRAPIYTLKPTDMKKTAARMVLRDVEVMNKELVITMGVG